MSSAGTGAVLVDCDAIMSDSQAATQKGQQSTPVGCIDDKELRKQRAPLKFSEKIWVGGTLTLITFLGLSVQLLLLDYYLKSKHRILITLGDMCWKILLPFNIGLSCIYFNYFLCVTSSPGRVPKGWSPPTLPQALSEQVLAVEDQVEEDDKPLLVRKHQQQRPPIRPSQPRYCRHCKAYKPPRAHHCKTCRSCTLRMDHHCPWLANCVGHNNYPHFLRFLYSVCVTCSAHLVLITCIALDYWGQTTSGYFRPPTTAVTVLCILNYIFCGITLLLVGVFTMWHIWLLCNNMTTVESAETDKVETMVRRGRLARGRDLIDFPFTLSPFWRNITVVLGPTPVHWFFMPGRKACDGDGLSYETCSQVEPHKQYDWPPKDPLKTLEHDYMRQKAGRREYEAAVTGGQNGWHGLSSSGSKQRAESMHQRRQRVHDVGGGELPTAHDAEQIEPELEGARSSALQCPSQSHHYNYSVSPWHPDFGLHRDDYDADEGRRSSDTSTDEDGEDEDADLGEENERQSLWPSMEGSRAPRPYPTSAFPIGEPTGDSDSSSERDGLSAHGDECLADGMRSRVRRGSEGYEVQPKQFDLAYEYEQTLLENQMMREHFLAQECEMHGLAADGPDAQDGGGARRTQTLLLPSEVLRQRAQQHDAHVHAPTP
ncbi:hypothetical protein K437DRAFT_2555 [Tilletiaria anomala UBC 951]|uniref:Palmitoyltransferase n=1 Tax=Tilletiaria anomala (strain ATCC 24038 / CBS 436.72 / UBC 951) TaxID=1037660 RepID=A0A066WLV1_TILAU|nr:uncharacterized protein K437DRAFT_2555 [Tilletiaria anomala UBC 951]KDN53573.1 hypothetical protein K437DRAFT_2555 [Tilletiaria anomala UBC 951]